MTIGFIGLGNMAKAMIGGMLIQKIVKKDEIYGSALSDSTLKKVQDTYGIHTTKDNLEVAKKADILILAVKPQFYPQVIEEIKGVITKKQIIVSIAPGKSMEWLTELFGQTIKMVRCMPNTPALVGEGCTGFCKNDKVSEEEVKTVKNILCSFGKAYEVPERLMDVVVGISGSSPAYVFLFIEAMADAAVAEGMSRSQAYEFSAQAVLGSAKMVLETGKHPGELKDMVCSPGGTTIQAVKVLEEKGFRGAVMDAVVTCIEKSKNI